jgi:AcrR family transcriptional regulator
MTEQVHSQSKRLPGRPRSPQVQEAILRATLQLLAEVGYEHMSIEAVAAHAGVGKTAIYRRWNSKEELIVDALASAKKHPKMPDSGNVQQDMLLWVEAFIQNLHDPIERQGVALLIGTLFQHAQLAERYWSKYLVQITQDLTEVLKRGQERGEIREDIALETVIDILSGAVIYQMFLKPSSDALLDEFRQAIAMLLQGIAGPKLM